MKRWKTKSLIALGIGASAYALVVPAFGQDAPESLLPEGFGDPVPPAPPPPPAPAPSVPSALSGAPAPAPFAPSAVRGITLDDESDIDEFDISDLDPDLAEIPPEYELPPRRAVRSRSRPLTPTWRYARILRWVDGRYLSP